MEEKTMEGDTILCIWIQEGKTKGDGDTGTKRNYKQTKEGTKVAEKMEEKKKSTNIITQEL